MAGFSGLRNLFRSSPKAKSAKLTKQSAAEKSEEPPVKQQGVNNTQQRDSVDLKQKNSIYRNHEATKSAPDLGERKYGSPFEERLNRRNSTGAFKSTPVDNQSRFGSDFEKRLNERSDKAHEATVKETKRKEEKKYGSEYERKLNEEAQTAEKTKVDERKYSSEYERKLNEGRDTQSQSANDPYGNKQYSQSEPNLSQHQYHAYRPDLHGSRSSGNLNAEKEPVSMPDPKDFGGNPIGFQHSEGTGNTSSLYSHSNSSRDSGFDEPVTLSSNGAFARDDHNFGGYSGQHNASGTTSRQQQQSLYQHNNDSSVSVSGRHGGSGIHTGQSSQSLRYKAYTYTQKQSDRMYDYSAKNDIHVHGQKDAGSYSQPYGKEKQDDYWGQQDYHYGNNTQVNHAEVNPYHNVDSAYGKQSNHGYQQVQMQNSHYGKQQSWQTGHDPMYTTGKNSYSNNYHQGSFDPKGMQTIKEDQVLNHFTPPPIKHEPAVKNNTEFHEPDGFAANNGMVINSRDYSGMTLRHNGRPDKIVVNNKEYQPGSQNIEVKNGDTVQVGNTLYKFNSDQKMVPISNDAEMVRELYPRGINDIRSQQGQIGDCAKMAQMHSLMTDPSGIGTKALLDTIKRHPSGQGYQVTTGSGYTTHIRTVKDEYGNVHVLGNKKDEAQGATGDPGFQVLERAHYRQVRNERFGKDEVTYTDQQGVLQRSNTLAKRNTDLDANWSSDYATKLVGNNGNFKSFTFDGTEAPAKQMSYLEKLKLKKSEPNMSEAEWQALQKQRWQNKTTFEDRLNDPAQAAKINQFFKDVKEDPSRFRGVAVSKYTDGNDTVKLKLSDGREIYGNHAYSFQGFKQVNGKEMVSLSNPHNAAEELNMLPSDFMKNFSMFDGLMRAS